MAFRGRNPGALPDSSYRFDDGVSNVGGCPTNATAAGSSHRSPVVSMDRCDRAGFALRLSYASAVANERVGVLGAGKN